MGKLLKVKEAALLLNVSRQTLWKWIKQRKIKAVKLPSGRYRIPEGEVVSIMQGRVEVAKGQVAPIKKQMNDQHNIAS